MKIKFFQIFETIATLSWLGMDFCWMNKYQTTALMLSLLALIFSIMAIVYYDGKKKSEVLILSASFFWVLMNSSWMIGEDSQNTIFTHISTWCFITSILMIVVAIIISRSEGEQIDFKRLKIK